MKDIDNRMQQWKIKAEKLGKALGFNMEQLEKKSRIRAKRIIGLIKTNER